MGTRAHVVATALAAGLLTGGCGGHGADPAAVVEPVAHTTGTDRYACPPGDVVDDAGGGETLPSGAVAARECPWPDHPSGDLSSPLDPRVLTTGADALVSAIDDAPVFAANACPTDAGLDVALAFFYADGSVRTALVTAAGCGTATVGGVARGSFETKVGDDNRFGHGLLVTLRRMLDHQRPTR